MKKLYTPLLWALCAVAVSAQPSYNPDGLQDAIYGGTASEESYVRQNTARAEQECLSGDAKKCHVLAWMFQKGDKITKNSEKSLYYAAKGCILGDAFCCDGVAYMTGIKSQYTKPRVGGGVGPCFAGIDEDMAYAYASEFLRRGEANEAVKCLELGCAKKRKGSGRSCAKLGSMYLDGYGVEFSHQKALEYYKKGCELGDIAACKGTKTAQEIITNERRIDEYIKSKQY